jgi:hypothetical protein
VNSSIEFNIPNRMEVLINSADEMYNTMKDVHTRFPEATFSNLEYVGLRDGQLSIKISYVVES